MVSDPIVAWIDRTDARCQVALGKRIKTRRNLAEGMLHRLRFGHAFGLALEAHMFGLLSFPIGLRLGMDAGAVILLEHLQRTDHLTDFVVGLGKLQLGVGLAPCEPRHGLRHLHHRASHRANHEERDRHRQDKAEQAGTPHPGCALAALTFRSRGDFAGDLHDAVGNTLQCGNNERCLLVGCRQIGLHCVEGLTKLSEIGGHIGAAGFRQHGAQRLRLLQPGRNHLGGVCRRLDAVSFDLGKRVLQHIAEIACRTGNDARLGARLVLFAFGGEFGLGGFAQRLVERLGDGGNLGEEGEILR